MPPRAHRLRARRPRPPRWASPSAASAGTQNLGGLRRRAATTTFLAAKPLPSRRSTAASGPVNRPLRWGCGAGLRSSAMVPHQPENRQHRDANRRERDAEPVQPRQHVSIRPNRGAGPVSRRFRDAEQDLIVRVAQAYFDVLAAQDALATTHQQGRHRQQLASAKRNFEVGTATITDTREAQRASTSPPRRRSPPTTTCAPKSRSISWSAAPASCLRLAVPVVLPPCSQRWSTNGCCAPTPAPADPQRPRLADLDVAKLETEGTRHLLPPCR